jgi:transcriptional regulator with XRE-family HTH domain
MDAANQAYKSSIDYMALGNRLRAYRVGASLLAEDVAEKLGISRAVVYRLEKGEIVKIETLERLAALLDTSMASLLGVEVEYYPTALGLFERMRQLEESADRILAHFEPISLLLTTCHCCGKCSPKLPLDVMSSHPAPPTSTRCSRSWKSGARSSRNAGRTSSV